MTAEIINLRRLKKQKARQEREKTAQINRELFGQSKANKKLITELAQQDARKLDGHKRET